MVGEGTVTWLDKARGRRATPGPVGLFTIKQVGDACGLPGPVIMQLVPRTWTDEGWMYTAEQLRAAVVIADNLRRARAANEPLPLHDPMDVLVCDRCDAVGTVHDTAWARWLNVVGPDSSVRTDPMGRDYCPGCVIPCPTCQPARPGEPCRECCGAGRIPRP